MTATTAERKRELRALLKQRRAALDRTVREQGSERIAARLFDLACLRSARRVFCYISFASEVDTHAVLRRLLGEGRQVVVPKILDRETMVAQPLGAWEDLTPGPLGILAPPDGPVWTEGVDVAITPGLGFTTRGDRIGFGAGYYDRWFAQHPVGCRVALAYECQLVDDLPSEPTDQRVDYVVTEDRLIETRAGGVAAR